MLTELQVFNAIHETIPYVHKVSRPNVPGSLGSVYIAKSIDGNFICKFNHKELAQKNELVSKALMSCGITIPEIKLYNYHDQWMEVYPMLPGKTLYEHIGNGLSRNKVQSIYHDIVDAIIKMNSLSPEKLEGLKYSKIGKVAKSNITDTNNSFIATVCSGVIYMVNKCDQKDKGIYHCGITPKNVILTDEGELMAILDLDEAGIADKNYAFGMMVAKYQQLGYNIFDLIDYYESKTGEKLNHKKIQNIANITNAGKHILWRLSHMTQSK